MDKERRNARTHPTETSRPGQESPSRKSVPIQIILATIFATVFLLVVAELALGWTFGPAEISFLVLIILVAITGGANYLARRRRHDSNERY